MELLKDENDQINLEYMFDKYGFEEIANPFFTEHNMLTYQHFHAKFYAAIFPQLNKAEVVETSFNILKAGEDYYENISMRDYPLEYFEKNFIEPLGFNLSEIKVLPESILEYPKQKIKKTIDSNGDEVYELHPIQAFVIVLATVFAKDFLVEKIENAFNDIDEILDKIPKLSAEEMKKLFDEYRNKTLN